MKSQMKQTTLFQHLKEFINNKWAWTDDAQFTTKQMREKIGKCENRTWWKEANKNPNYVLHTYLGQLRELGCITRVSHGKYKINRGIPEWFGSFHFNGLKGKLEHYNNLYWNSLPPQHKVNPWEEVLLFNELRRRLNAPVQSTIESRIAAVQKQVDEQTKALQDIRNVLIMLQAEADEQNTPKQTGHSRVTVQTDTWNVEYLGIKYVVCRDIESYDDNHMDPDFSWYVTEDGDIVDGDIAQYLIDWVRENN